MQSLARQMNLSETTFVVPSERDGVTADIRIFTPTCEMSFAGHPTLGTAFVVAGAIGAEGPPAGSTVVLGTKAGDITVTLAGISADSATCTLRTARRPTTRAPRATNAEIAAMVGLPASAVSGPPLWVDTGVEQLVVPIASPALVRAARPSAELLALHGYGTTADEAMVYLFSKEADEMRVRFFFTQHGAVVEDPATGSACANLGGYLVATAGARNHSVVLRQGDAVGRPSRLGLRIGEQGEIFVSGEVIALGEGSMAFPS